LVSMPILNVVINNIRVPLCPRTVPMKNSSNQHALLSLGLGAGTLLLVKGEIMGCAGITSSITLFPKKMWSDPEQYWKLVFLSSFSLTASLIFGPDSITDKRALDKDGGVPFVSSFANVLGGLLVGFGEWRI
jgi:hypothetical protein